MKRFKFSLESLVLLRELELKQVEEAYGKAVQKIQELEQNRQGQVKEYALLQSAISEQRKGSFQAYQQEYFLLEEQQQQTVMAGIEQQIESAKAQKQTLLNHYLKMKRAYEALIEMKGKKYQEYLREEAKKEERELEDLTNFRHWHAN